MDHNDLQNVSLTHALELDKEDNLSQYREQFHIPEQSTGKSLIYLCGNSLGLQPKSTRAALEQELLDWQSLGVEGHLYGKNPWLPYHEYLSENMAHVVGAKSSEVVVMNSLSVNIHLMMVSFYQPTPTKNKIIIESDVFPSDRYAVASQIDFHGYDPRECIVELRPREGEYTLRQSDIVEAIEIHGQETALIFLGNVNYYTGQFFNMKTISDVGHKQGCIVGFDCAHGAGNVELNLHDFDVDFAVWCSYKYLNSGPGSLGACYVHERHLNNPALPKFKGWWGHNKETRFNMRDDFNPILSVESWQLSNPSILSMAAIKASLEVFESAGISNLRKKSVRLTSYLENQIMAISSQRVKLITPSDIDQRGCQLSLLVEEKGRQVFDYLTDQGVIADWREPDVIRIAPVPLYNTYEDCWNFSQLLKNALAHA